MKRVLVYRFSAIGDVIMLLPVIKGALNANPDIEITLVSRPFFAPIFDGIERLNFVGINPKDYSGIKGIFRIYKKMLYSSKPGIILDMHQVLRTHLLNVFFNIINFKKVYKIKKGKAEKKHIVKTKKLKEIPSTIDRYKAVFIEAGINVIMPEPPLLNITDRNEIVSKLNIGDPGKYKLIGIAPFSAHLQKMWSFDKIKSLILELENLENVQILLFGGGKSELEQLETIARTTKHTLVVGNIMKFSQEIELMPHLSLMISMDSANMHLATMANIPVISIWGATHPILGFAPYKQSLENIIQYSGDEINCRPCSVYGNKACKLSDKVKCMKLIEVETVLNRAQQILL